MSNENAVVLFVRNLIVKMFSFIGGSGPNILYSEKMLTMQKPSFKKYEIIFIRFLQILSVKQCFHFVLSVYGKIQLTSTKYQISLNTKKN